MRKGSLVVNSSQGGGSKDTGVLEASPASPCARVRWWSIPRREAAVKIPGSWRRLAPFPDEASSNSHAAHQTPPQPRRQRRLLAGPLHRTRRNTATSISSVNLPVEVFCWLG